MVRAGAILADGSADAILASVRPTFDTAAQTIEESLKLVELSQDAATFLDEADPDALAAFQALTPTADVIRQVLALALKFGPRSLAFPLIVKPVEAGVGDYFNLMKDAALFTEVFGADGSVEA